jgi:hypothetical protein
VSQFSDFCRQNPLCCFSTSVCCCKRVFRYRLSPETFGYTLVFPRETDTRRGSHFVQRMVLPATAMAYQRQKRSDARNRITEIRTFLGSGRTEWYHLVLDLRNREQNRSQRDEEFFSDLIRFDVGVFSSTKFHWGESTTRAPDSHTISISARSNIIKTPVTVWIYCKTGNTHVLFK